MPSVPTTASIVKKHTEDIIAHLGDVGDGVKNHITGKFEEAKDHLDNVGDDIEERWKALDAKVDGIAKPVVHSVLTPLVAVGVAVAFALLGWELAQLLK